MTPRSGSGGPGRGPRGPKTTPRAPQECPRSDQERPRGDQKGIKNELRLSAGPGSPPGAILERFSSLRGAILERFWKDFRALGKLSSELSGLCVGPPSATFFPRHPRTRGRHRRDTGGTHQRRGTRQRHRRETAEPTEEHARATGGTRKRHRRNIFRTFLAAVSLAPSGPGPGRQQGNAKQATRARAKQEYAQEQQGRKVGIGAKAARPPG